MRRRRRGCCTTETSPAPSCWMTAPLSPCPSPSAWLVTSSASRGLLCPCTIGCLHGTPHAASRPPQCRPCMAVEIPASCPARLERGHGCGHKALVVGCEGCRDLPTFCHRALSSVRRVCCSPHALTRVQCRVALNAPDGTPLVRELTFDVPTGRSVLVMGPNGCGKSSLFRVLSGLWPLQASFLFSPTPSPTAFMLTCIWQHGAAPALPPERILRCSGPDREVSRLSAGNRAVMLCHCNEVARSICMYAGWRDQAA